MEAASENPAIDSDLHSVDSDRVFGQFSEAFASRKRRVFRHMKTQTSTKTSNKKLQFCPDLRDSSLQVTASCSSLETQTSGTERTSVGTETPVTVTADKGLIAAAESSDREVQAVVGNWSEGVQTEEYRKEAVGVQCGSFFFYLRSVATQVQKITESKASQAETKRKTSATQWDSEGSVEKEVQARCDMADADCECRKETAEKGTDALSVHWEKRAKGAKERMKRLREEKVKLATAVMQEMNQWKAEAEVQNRELQCVLEAIAANSNSQPAEKYLKIQDSLSDALEQLRISREELESTTAELTLKVELLQSENASNYLLIRDLESMLVSEIEDKAEIRAELAKEKEVAEALERQMYALRLREIELLEPSSSQVESEQVAMELQVKVAQAEIDILNLKRTISEKDNKIKESNEFIDSLHYQIQTATRDTERVRIDSQSTYTFYQSEIARLQSQLHVCRFELKQFQEGNRKLCEELESMKETQSEYSMKASLLAQAKTKAEIALKGALSDAKHSEEEITLLRKTVSRLQKQVRDFEELVQQNKVMMHLTADADNEETFDTEVQIQRLESEKLELQTDIVDLRRECDTLKDRLELSSESLKKLQEALELQKVKSVTLENVLSLTKSSLTESRELRDSAEQKCVALSEQLAASSSRTWQLEKQVEDAQASLKAEQMQMQALTRSFEVQREQNAALAKLSDDLQAQLSAEMRTRAEAEALCKQMQFSTESRERRWAAEKEELVTLNEQISGRIDGLQRDVGEREDSMRELQILCDQMKNDKLAAEAAKFTLESELSQAKSRIAEFTKIAEKSQSLEAALKENQERMSHLTEVHKKCEETVAALTAENSKLHNAMRKIEEEIAESERKRAEESDKMIAASLLFEQRQLTFYNDKEKLESELRTARKETEAANQHITSLQSSESALRTSVQSLQVSLQESEQLRIAAEKEAAASTDSAASASADKERYESLLLSATEEFKELSSQVEELKSANGSLAERLDAALLALQEKADLSVEEARELRHKVESLESGLKSTSEKLRVSQESEDRLQTKKEELTERLMWYQSEYEKASVLKKANLQLTERNISLTEELRTVTELLQRK